jgi:ornithine decarboxylase
MPSVPLGMNNDTESVAEIAEISSFLKDNDVLLVDRDLNTDELIDTVIEKMSPVGSFYIINLHDIIKKVNLWNKLFEGISIMYAVKSNPDNVICKLLAQLGVGFDVASENELKSVKNIVEPNRIIYANPVKQTKSISYARSIDVDLLVVDCENELYKIILYHPHAQILVRIKVDDSGSLCKFSSKFGIDKSEVPTLLKLAKSMSLNVVGVCFHIGSGCFNAEKYYDALRDVSEVFEMAKDVGFEFNTIDLGGGMPADLCEENMKLLKDMSENVKMGLNDFFGDTKYSLRLLAEPGRYIVGSSHTFVIDVVGKKRQKDCNGVEKISYTLNDGLYASFNCITYDHQKPVIIPYNNRDEKKYPSSVKGCTCDSIDVISNDILLPELEVGDLLYVQNFGAYTRASSSSFNGFNDIRLIYVISK